MTALEIEKMSPSALALHIHGKLDKEDYQRFVPLAEESIEAHEKINLLIKISNFRGWSPAALWELRKSGVGLLGNAKGDRRPIPFVEDTAVPPERLAAYICEFRALLDAAGLEYGISPKRTSNICVRSRKLAYRSWGSIRRLPSLTEMSIGAHAAVVQASAWTCSRSG